MTDSSGGVKVENAPQLKDPERFYCPFPGCNRSFAELWRLKVHYRAPPDIRGSGKERGHGTELSHCPKCGKTLKPGKHHVGCSAGRSAPRQATKRTRVSHPDSSILDVALIQDGFQEETSIPDHIMQQLMGNAQQYCKTETEPSAIADFMQHAQSPALPVPDAQQQQLNFQGMQCPTVPMVSMDHQMQHHFGDGQQQAQQQQHQVQAQQQAQFGSNDSSPSFPPFNNQGASQFTQQPSTSAPTLNLQLVEQGNLQNVFDYDEMENRVPSPPPLPPDFHDDDKGTGGFFFNFSQFSERLPSTVQPPPAPYDLVGTSGASTSDQSWDTWSGKLCSQTTNDGDLMQILFGLPDEYPIMATSHLHHFERPSTPTPTSGSPATNTQANSTFDFTDESPRFSTLMHVDDLGHGLDIHMDRSDGGDFACSPMNNSAAMEHAHSMNQNSKSSIPEQSTEATGLKPLNVLPKKVESSGFHSETHLSPTALLKDTNTVLPRICTFEQELYQLLRPCE